MPNGYIRVDHHDESFTIIASLVIAIVLVFFPVAGFLADVKIGQYNNTRHYSTTCGLY